MESEPVFKVPNPAVIFLAVFLLSGGLSPADTVAAPEKVEKIETTTEQTVEKKVNPVLTLERGSGKLPFPTESPKAGVRDVAPTLMVTQQTQAELARKKAAEADEKELAEKRAAEKKGRRSFKKDRR